MSDSVAAAPAKRSGALAEVVELIKTIGAVLSIALLLRVFVFQPFTIPSASMEPNLYQGDYIIVTKYAYGWSRHSIPFSPALFEGRLMGRAPDRGDIVVFKLPRDGRTDYIKRVIGLPGDRVEVKGGVVYLNGDRVPRQRTASVREESGFGFARDVMRYTETLPEGRRIHVNDYGPDGGLDDAGPFVVPEGHFFVMGDNRDNSLDSRLPTAEGVGFVPAQNLVGKAEFVLLAWSAKASLFKPWTWVLDAEPERFFKRLR